MDEARIEVTRRTCLRGIGLNAALPYVAKAPRGQCCRFAGGFGGSPASSTRRHPSRRIAAPRAGVPKSFRLSKADVVRRLSLRPSPRLALFVALGPFDRDWIIACGNHLVERRIESSLIGLAQTAVVG